MSHLFSESAAGLLWARLTFATASLIAASFAAFAVAFPSRRRLARDPLITALSAIGCAFVILAFSDTIVRALHTDPDGRLRLTYGYMYPFFALYFVAAFAISFVSLWQKYQVVRGAERLRIRYLFAGTFLAVAGGATTNLLIPLLFHTSRFNLLGPLFTVFAITFVAHAIVRHRLMDIRVVLRRSTTYVVAFVACAIVVIGLPALIYSLFDKAFAPDILTTTIGAAIMVAAVFPPLLRWLHRRLDRYAYRASYDQSKTLGHVTRKLSSFLERDALLRYIRSVVRETVPSECVVFFLRSNGGYSLYELGEGGGGFAAEEAYVAGADPIVTHLSNESTAVVREEVPPHAGRAHSDVFRSLTTRNWDLVLPLRTERQLAGFVALGPKLSGDPYFEADIELLSAIAGQTAVALTNATLYQEVRDVKDHLESVLKNMEGGVIAVTATGMITTANTVAAELLGLQASDLIGKPLSNLPAVLYMPLEATIKDGTPTAQLEADLGSDTGPMPIVLSTSLLRDSEGSIRGAILLFGDHSKIKELEEEKRRSERLADFRSMAFGIAHEIKNPLVAIKTFAELVPERYGDQDFRENFLRVAVGEIDRIDELVARLRGLGEPESRPLQNISLIEPLNDTLSLLEGQLSQRGIRPLRQFGPSLPLIRGDFAQLKQLFLNLMLNAIEAMEEGGVLTVTVASQQQRDGSASVAVEIGDTGVGISETVSGRLFDPFVTSKPRGSGLGLSISRGIADAHRATIRIASQVPPPGTVVTVDFPALST